MLVGSQHQEGRAGRAFAKATGSDKSKQQRRDAGDGQRVGWNLEDTREACLIRSSPLPSPGALQRCPAPDLFNIPPSPVALLEWGRRDAPLIPSEPVPGGEGCGTAPVPCPGRQEKAVPPQPPPSPRFGLPPAEPGR